MVTIKVRKIKSDSGFGGSTPQGTVTVSAIIQSDELGRLEIGVQVLNQGNSASLTPDYQRRLLQTSGQKGQAMCIYIFKSETRKELRAFAGDPGGSKLPSQHGPWTVTGVEDQGEILRTTSHAM
jgi:hypothetical protein